MKKRRLKASILIAGKEAQQRQSLHKKIAATGIDVIETDTGYMCLQLAAQKQPDILLIGSDIRLPHTAALCRNMRRHLGLYRDVREYDSRRKFSLHQFIPFTRRPGDSPAQGIYR